MSSDWKLQLFAGSASATVACVACQPMDLVKTRLQQRKSAENDAKYNTITSAIRNIIKDDGVLGLWHGSGSTALRVIPGAGLYFMLLHGATTQHMRRTGRAMTFTESLFVGSAARAMAAVVANPFAVAKSRVESVGVFSYDTTADAVKDVFRNAYTRGLTTQILSDVIYSGVSFSIVNQATRPFSSGKPSMPAQFAISAGAGLIGTMVAYPLDVLKTRLALARKEAGEHVAMWPVAREMMREEPAAFVKGMPFVMARRGVTTAVTWSMYRYIVALAGKGK